MKALFKTVRSGAAGLFAPMQDAPTTAVTASLVAAYAIIGPSAVTSSLVAVYGIAATQTSQVSASLVLAYAISDQNTVSVSASFLFKVEGPATPIVSAQAFQYLVAGVARSVKMSSAFVYSIIGTTPPVVGIPGPVSQARTYVVTEPQSRPTDLSRGTFWNYANLAKPKGTKDPDEVLDIPFDWTAWLLDASDSYAGHTIKVTGGLAVVSSYQKDGIIVVYVRGGTVGTTATITCHIRTTSNTNREAERTVYLKIKDL